jgi:hypothetical protein
MTREKVKVKKGVEREKARGKYFLLVFVQNTEMEREPLNIFMPALKVARSKK